LIMGTAAYMSPEQARGKKNDARSDIFSLGIVFYEMLTGRRAFVGETTLESISSIMKDEPQPISQFLPEVPPEIERIVNKTLRKEPKERYQTAKDLLIDLKSAKHDLELHDSFGRVPNRESIKTEILPVSNTDENQNQLTSSENQIQLTKSAEYIAPRIKNYNFVYPTFAFLLIAAIGIGIFGTYEFSSTKPKNNPLESVKITKITDSGKVGERVALSRDGKWLAYSIVDGGKVSLWLKQVAVPDSNTQIVPQAETYYRELSFSPDGNYLYYSVLEGTANNMTVYQMPILGGGTTRKFLSGINGGINFSPDSKQITYGVEDLENDESILMVANADGSEPRELVKLKGNDEIASSRGRWSPDGKSIALWVGTNNPHSQELATVSVATGEITKIETPKFNDFLLWEWLADGKGLIVLASEKPSQKAEFWKISYPSGDAEKITNDLNDYSSLSLTADSNTLATVQSSSTSHIWTVPINDSTQAKQITSGSNADFDPHWTPDGKLVFERIPGDIYIVNPNGGSPQRLTTNSANRFPTVSPDGKYVVYVSTQTGIPLIWRMDIDGGNPKQLTTEFSVEPNISPNGQEVIYSAGVDSSRIWKVGIDGGQPVQLTDKESRNAIFSPDGKHFACRWWETPKSQQKIAIIPSEGGKPVKIFALNAAEIRWMPDGRSFQYLVIKDGLSSVWSQPIDGGAPQQITKFSKLIQSFNLSSDGKQIAVSRGTSTSDVVLISGFRK
jgi:eukaryotic-like serine/threonine-protein kinase